MKKAQAQTIESLRNLAASTLSIAMKLELPNFDTKGFKNTKEATQRITEWTRMVRQNIQFARTITAAMDKLADTASFIDKEVEKLDLFSEAESLLKKGDYPIARKAYDAARIAEAVKNGFKA